MKPAQDGTLVILVGGKEAVVEQCRPYFEILGTTFTRFGDHGSGSMAKLVINSLLAITVQGASEALLFAEKVGLDRNQVLHMIAESAVGTPLIQGKKELYMNERFPTAFMLKLMSKDIGFPRMFHYGSSLAILARVTHPLRLQYDEPRNLKR